MFHKNGVTVKQIENLVYWFIKQFPVETYPSQLVETEVLKIAWVRLAEYEGIKDPEKYLPFIYKLTELEYSKLVNFTHLIQILEMFKVTEFPETGSKNMDLLSSKGMV